MAMVMMTATTTVMASGNDNGNGQQQCWWQLTTATAMAMADGNCNGDGKGNGTSNGDDQWQWQWLMVTATATAMVAAMETETATAITMPKVMGMMTITTADTREGCLFMCRQCAALWQGQRLATPPPGHKGVWTMDCFLLIIFPFFPHTKSVPQEPCQPIDGLPQFLLYFLSR